MSAVLPPPSAAPPSRAGTSATALASLALWGLSTEATAELLDRAELDITVLEPSMDILRQALTDGHDFDVIAYQADDPGEAADLAAVVRGVPPRLAVVVIGKAGGSSFQDSATLPYDVWHEPDVAMAAAIFTPLLRSVREREALTAIEAHRAIDLALDEVLLVERDLGEAVADAMHALATGLSCDGASFWRPSASGKSLIRVGCTGPDPRLDSAAAGGDRQPAANCDRLLELLVDDTPAGEVMRTGRPRFPVKDETSLLLPARANGRVCGVVVLSGAHRVARRRTSFELAVSAAERVAALVQAQLAAQQFNAVTAGSPLAIIITDAAGRMVSLNETAERLCGMPLERALDRPVLDLLEPEFRASEKRRLRNLVAAARAQRPQTIELTITPAEARERFVELTISSWGQGLDRRYALILQDVTERHLAERRIALLAYSDRISGLPNQPALMRDLQNPPPGSGALVALEICHFDRFDDALGSSTAEVLVRLVAARLRDVVPASTDVYHLSRATFLLTVAAADRERVVTDVETICARVAEPLDVEGANLYIKTAAGVCLLDGAVDPSTAGVDGALQALRHARDSDSPRPCVHDPGDPSDRDRLRRERDLHRAVNESQLRLVYQPIVELRGERVRHFEALARWQHPELGLLAPDRFIDIAEENGLIIEIGNWVIEEACRQLAQWQRELRFDGSISFNVAPRQLLADNLADRIAAAAGRHGVAPSHLIAEVVESSALQDLETANHTLNAIRATGVAVALDDFGVGQSSLGRLASLPVDILKIDRSLICGLPDSRSSRAITHSAIRLAGELGLEIVTEGIETPQQRDYLKAAGSRFGQGYLFSHPLASEHAARLIDPAAATT